MPGHVERPTDCGVQAALTGPAFTRGARGRMPRTRRRGRPIARPLAGGTALAAAALAAAACSAGGTADGPAAGTAQASPVGTASATGANWPEYDGNPARTG